MDFTWSEIQPGTLHKVDTTWEWYRTKGSDLQEQFLIRYDRINQGDPVLPNLQGMQIAIITESSKTNFIRFQLENSSDLDVFEQLFDGIIKQTEKCNSNEHAVKVTLQQLSRWQQMLRNKYKRKLSKEEQKGLIGELHILKNVLTPYISSPSEVLTCWTGPTGSPKDFGIGHIAIEVKARRGTSEPFVQISSEHQLDDSDVSNLYLCVVLINEAPAEIEHSFTLIDKINELKALYEDLPDVQEQFLQLLNAYPHANFEFNIEDEYTDRYTFGGIEYYQITEDFPKITGSDIAESLSRVRYTLALNSCSDYIVPDTDITTYLEGGLNLNGNS